MWNVEPDKDGSRGGFQDRDAGRSNFRKDFGPDYGIDFARFSDIPDLKKDQLLLENILISIPPEFPENNISVRNGFIILKGFVASDQLKSDIERIISDVPGVQFVINQLETRI